MFTVPPLKYGALDLRIGGMIVVLYSRQLRRMTKMVFADFAELANCGNFTYVQTSKF
jgi:hypothetical protein